MPQPQANWRINSLTSDNVEAIVSGRYAPPCQAYKLTERERGILANPAKQYYTVRDQSGALVGYCCFGLEGQVPSGNFPADGEGSLDVGLGLDPTLVGMRLGPHFVGTILAFGRLKFQPELFQVTIAAFNQRSIKTFLSVGFEQSNVFERRPDGLPFVQLVRRATMLI